MEYHIICYRLTGLLAFSQPTTGTLYGYGIRGVWSTILYAIGSLGSLAFSQPTTGTLYVWDKGCMEYHIIC